MSLLCKIFGHAQRRWSKPDAIYDVIETVVTPEGGRIMAGQAVAHGLQGAVCGRVCLRCDARQTFAQGRIA
jgi:hypothetical protein